MKHNLGRAALYVTTAIAALTGAAPAFAQDAGATLGEVVVTARRVEERLQDVPISMTVFNQEQLAQRNIVNPTDLAAYTPSLTTNQRFGSEKSSFVIRGFTQEAGTSPSVGVYFADVVVPRAAGGTTSGNTALPGAFFDLQNVQVLKGPQGTLFGRNTTGGAVLLVPQKPTDRFEGYVEGSAGNYDMWRTQAVVNLPLADTLRVRLGVDRMQREGYMKNHSGIGPDDYNDSNYWAARFSIVADLTDNLENYTIFSYNNSFTHGYAPRLLACRQTGGVGAAALLGPLACAQIARQAARGDGMRDVEINNPKPLIDLRQVQGINTTTWRVSENLTVKNIVSYAEFQERSSFSLNGENFQIPAGPLAGRPFNYILLNPAPTGAQAAQSTFTEELQFQGQTPDQRLVWQAGAYLEISNPTNWSQGYTAILLSCTDIRTVQCVNPFGGGQISASRTETYFNNKGFYGQGTYKLTDQLSLTAGIRYTIDKTRGVSQNTRIRVLPGVVGGFQDIVCNDTLRFNVPDGPDPGTSPDALVVNNAALCNFQIKTKSKKPTWLLDLDYKPTDDILLYAKWSRGYRQGGINMTNVGLEAWGPEKVNTYEGGAKTSWAAGPVRGIFNVAGFYNDFTNQQITANLIAKPESGLAGGAAIVNAGKSRIWGAEVDASARYGPFSLDVGYSYLNTTLKAISLPTLAADSPFSQIIATAQVGGDLSFSPKNRVTATATYRLPLAEDLGDVSIGATFVHTDKQNATGAAASPLFRLPATDLLNLNLDWKNVTGRPIDLSLFATNVTNEIYSVGVLSSINSAGFEGVLIGPPRMYGVRLRYRFGG